MRWIDYLVQGLGIALDPAMLALGAIAAMTFRRWWASALAALPIAWFGVHLGVGAPATMIASALLSGQALYWGLSRATRPRT